MSDAADLHSRAQVVTVDERGTVTGVADRHQAHVPPGRLHLAVSVQLVDDDGRWIVQRRAASKLLFASRWANSCCTHPKPNEPLKMAASRRVYEELGLHIVGLDPMGTFLYQAHDDTSGLVEHELDHVYLARAVGMPKPSPVEVDELAHLSLDEAIALLATDDAAPWATRVVNIAAGRSASG